MPSCARRSSVAWILALAACSGGAPQRPTADDLTLAQVERSCAFAELDGSGLAAAEIPMAHTPGCGYTTFPAPILAACTEPLAPGSVDLRGVWLDESRSRGHLERIEQCGDRFTVTSGGVVHDMRTDGTYEHGVNDVSARGCAKISVKAEFIGGVHTLSPHGLPLTVTRQLDGDMLVWDYPTGEYRLTRLCGPSVARDPVEIAAILHAG